MHPRISIRGCVRPSDRPSDRRVVRSVGNPFLCQKWTVFFIEIIMVVLLWYKTLEMKTFVKGFIVESAHDAEKKAAKNSILTPSKTWLFKTEKNLPHGLKDVDCNLSQHSSQANSCEILDKDDRCAQFFLTKRRSSYLMPNDIVGFA